MSDLKTAVKDQLLARKYTMVRTQNEEIIFFLKEAGGTVECLCLADDRGGALERFGYGFYDRLSVSIGEYIRNEWSRFSGHSFAQYNMLAVILTDNVVRSREQAGDSIFYWLVDEDTRRLVVYENQPGEYGPARDCIERALAGKGTEAWKELVTPVNTLLIAVNILIFAIMEILGDTRSAAYVYHWGGFGISEFLTDPQWFRLITSAFLHFGVQHLFNNMLVLLVTGAQLEKLLGWKKYSMLYLLSAIGANAISLLWNIHTGDVMVVSAGASGAIFGVLGALLAILLRRRGHVDGISRNQLFLVIGFTLFHGISTAGVNNSAHIGGLITGFLLGAVLFRTGNRAARQ